VTSASAGAAMRGVPDERVRRPPIRRRLRRRLAKYALVAPAAVIFALFFVMPVVASVVISFFRWSGIEESEFIGLANYRRLRDDPVFLTNIRVTLLAAAAALLSILPAATLLAVSLSGPGRLMSVFRWILFLPVVMPLSAAALLWTEIFNPNNGLANIVLGWVGVDPVTWLGEKGTALWALIIVTIWSSLGLHIVILLSGLSAIPVDLKEAARLETSSSWKLFRHIVLPLLRDSLTVSAVLIVTGTFVFFTSLAAIMTRGGPSHATEVLGMRAYLEAFTSLSFGRASAVTVVSMFITMALVGLILLIGHRKRIEY
jgi:ABC-type sugar transport system permease subunit